ncbi:hypothetical protein, conserved in T. vivax [Trypanosoma vivax Y486]|uniref:Uncharacterized protein n=1 Tax=Trypanosoma vivax (strain Y486) TaxID=1055687 RepID=F9WVM6_TRYVY|nr:hypothetical protein, conserved in T. vivax [Trypanosoma vivax Y486]|eukprot:CCD21634.1 hypothetical protein, conserved in T. vivax [Trypanosoma vivax Y486]
MHTVRFADAAHLPKTSDAGRLQPQRR